MANAEVTMLPQTYVTLTDENDIRQLNRTLDLLMRMMDVQAVYHNWMSSSFCKQRSDSFR